MKVLRLIFISLFIIKYSQSAFGGIDSTLFLRDKNSFSGVVHFIHIGIDHYNNESFSYGLNNAKKDAYRFKEFLDKDPGIDTIHPYGFYDYCSKASLEESILKIREHADVNDLFVFYYSGMHKNGYIHFTNDSLHYRELMNYSLNVYIKRQLLLFDMYDGAEFINGVKDDLRKSPDQKIGLDLDRILISFDGLSLDGQDFYCNDIEYTGGTLTGSIVTGDLPISTLFQDERTDYILTKLKSEWYKCGSADGYDPDFDLIFFSEKEFIDNYLVSETPGTKGATDNDIQEIINRERRIIKNGQTLCILVANSEFEEAFSFKSLQTPIEDVEKIKESLDKNYYVETVILSNLSYQQFLDTLKGIKRYYKFEAGSQVLFYGSSHGVKDEDSPFGYFIFPDTDSKRLDQTAMCLPLLLMNINSWTNKTAIMMDICHSAFGLDNTKLCSGTYDIRSDRNGAFFKNQFGPNHPLFAEDRAQEKCHLYLGASIMGKAKDGIKGQHSPFSQSFISFLNNEPTPITDTYFLKEHLNADKNNIGGFNPFYCSAGGEQQTHFYFIKK